MSQDIGIARHSPDPRFVGPGYCFLGRGPGGSVDGRQRRSPVTTLTAACEVPPGGIAFHLHTSLGYPVRTAGVGMPVAPPARPQAPEASSTDRRLGLSLLVIATAQLMLVLDDSIAN